ncbi:hypothetical protein, partial [Streptomyces sp. NPDC057729]|uniref:hypothetical protein n=1 Tax=Streptomyces sp. NPDC057729 TaxID=3346230 RepID=UPI0036C21650
MRSTRLVAAAAACASNSGVYRGLLKTLTVACVRGKCPSRHGSWGTAALEVISFGEVGRLSVMVGIVERLVPDELWELF